MGSKLITTNVPMYISDDQIEISIKTGDKAHMATRNKLFMMVYGEKGVSDEIELDRGAPNGCFQPTSKDVFKVHGNFSI